MARKKDKDKKDKKEEEEGRSGEAEVMEDNESEYEINTIEDYFRVLREVFDEIREFVKDTNVTLNVTLSALRDIVPMVTSGDADLGVLNKILGDVNLVLENYISKQEKLAKKIASVSRALSDQTRLGNMLREFFSRPYRINFVLEKEKKDVIIPSAVVKDKEIIEKTFGVEIIDDDKEK